MKREILKPKTVKEAARKAGGFAALARRINRNYRTLCVYREQGTAPADIVAVIEAIASEVENRDKASNA